MHLWEWRHPSQYRYSGGRRYEPNGQRHCGYGIPGVDLSISKALCPSVVSENGQLTYTFVIENAGSLSAGAADNVILSDTFDPRLSDITVSFNGEAWSEGVNYTYDAVTGVFRTLPGQITVSAAMYAQQTDGTWAVRPGTATLTVTGTV